MQEFGKKLVLSSKCMRQSILQNTTFSRQCRRPWQRAPQTDESSLIIRHRCLTDLQYQQLVVFRWYLPKHQSQQQQWPGSGLMASAKPGRHLQEPLFSYKTRHLHYTSHYTPKSRLSFMLKVSRCSKWRVVQTQELQRKIVNSILDCVFWFLLMMKLVCLVFPNF